MRTPLPIGNGFYISDSLPISAQECVNWYPNMPQAAALSKETLFGTPGIYQIATTGSSADEASRGTRTLNGRPYYVNANVLYRLNADFSLDSLGTIEGVGRVFLSDNGTQLFIMVPGGKGYIFTEDPDTLTEITDTAFRANGDPYAVVFIDGYFVLTTDQNKFIISSLKDGLSYNALDFGSAESSPDGVVVPLVFNNQLFIIGEITTEAYNNIGGADFPFQRSGLYLDEGTLAPFSAINSGNTWMFLGQGENEEPSIYSFENNTTNRISTQAVDKVLSRLTDTELADVWAWSYSQFGHFFVGFNLPETTFVYDSTTGRWHERKSEYLDGNSQVVKVRSRPNSVVSAYGLLIVGDSQDGRIGVLDVDTYTEYDNQLLRVAATQPFYNNMKPFFTPYLELVVESGVGDTVKVNPMMRMDRSLDGGKTWTNQRDRAMGKQGEYDRRVIWRRLGRTARFDVYRFTLSDPVKPVIIGLYADIRNSQHAEA